MAEMFAVSDGQFKGHGCKFLQPVFCRPNPLQARACLNSIAEPLSNRVINSGALCCPSVPAVCYKCAIPSNAAQLNKYLNKTLTSLYVLQPPQLSPRRTISVINSPMQTSSQAGWEKPLPPAVSQPPQLGCEEGGRAFEVSSHCALRQMKCDHAWSPNGLCH